MNLRPELMPPILDVEFVTRLAELAERLDGGNPQHAEKSLAEFNRLAGTTLPLADFQGIWKGEDHEDWVRRVLYHHLIEPVPDVTRDELIEIVRRSMPTDDNLEEYEGYMAVFDANVPLEGASNLLFYPPDYDAETNTWDGGRPMGDYSPTPEQIVDWALNSAR